MRTKPATATAKDGPRPEPPCRLGFHLARGMDARVAAVRAALRDEGGRLTAQPIVDLRTGDGAGEELFLRLVSRDGRVDLPGPYLEASERYSLAMVIDGWVLERAMELAGGGRRLHVNLSGRTVADCSFAARVEAALERYGADPALLTFEIAETAEALDGASPSGCAERIAALGSSLALDDFGTGYGSLTHLHSLPVSMIKIDREFVARIVRSPRSREIVKSVAAMAARLGLTTVGEGVEDADTLAALSECGVDRAQGFHVGRPVLL